MSTGNFSDSEMAWYELGVVLLKQELKEGANEALNQALKADPFFTYADYRRSTLFQIDTNGKK